MKRMKGMLLVALLAMAGAGAAADKAVDAAAPGSGAATPSISDVTMSGNDEWACKVAMCMANPGGPTQFAECVEPIQRLRRHLSRGKPYPVCRFLGGGGGSSTGGGAGRTERDPAQAL